MITRAPVDDRVRATGIVADHPADHTAILSGGFGGKEEPMGCEREVQFVSHDTGLNSDTASGHVDFENASQVTRNIDYDSPADDLSGQ